MGSANVSRGSLLLSTWDGDFLTIWWNAICLLLVVLAKAVWNTIVFVLTACTLVGAGDAPAELPVSSLTILALDFEKDLNMSDFSRWRGVGLLIGFLSVDLLSA
jgi:hypothetical protein